MMEEFQPSRSFDTFIGRFKDLYDAISRKILCKKSSGYYLNIRNNKYDDSSVFAHHYNYLVHVSTASNHSSKLGILNKRTKNNVSCYCSKLAKNSIFVLLFFEKTQLQSSSSL